MAVELTQQASYLPCFMALIFVVPASKKSSIQQVVQGLGTLKGFYYVNL